MAYVKMNQWSSGEVITAEAMNCISSSIDEIRQFMGDYNIKKWVVCPYCRVPNLFENFSCVKCGAPLESDN